MYKALTIAVLAALTQCGFAKFGIKHFLKQQQPSNDWPQLNLYTTFSTDATLYQLANGQLTPYKDITATIKVDSDRNKVKVNAKVGVPIIGKVSAEVLADLTQGVAYEYVPFLGICQKTPLNVTLQIKDVLNAIYSPTGGVTTYDGESQPAWDKTNEWKFHGSGPDATVVAYFDESTHNGKWIEAIPTNTTLPTFVASIPKGEQPATFQDSDFVISGCSAFSEDPATRVNIWID